jgi:hypothetical protein
MKHTPEKLRKTVNKYGNEINATVIKYCKKHPEVGDITFIFNLVAVAASISQAILEGGGEYLSPASKEMLDLLVSFETPIRDVMRKKEAQDRIVENLSKI